MHDFLTELSALSLGGAAVIAVLALLSYFSRKRYAAGFRCWIWLALCLRLALVLPLPQLFDVQSAPVRIPVPEDIVVFEPQQPDLPAPDRPEQPHLPAPGPVLPEEIPPKPVKPAGTVHLFDLLGILWALGALLTAGWAIFTHVRFLRFVRRWSRPAEGRAVQELQEWGRQLQMKCLPALRTCSGLAAPMLAGLFRPVLLLPEAPLDAAELHCTLLHELLHAQRRDIGLKALCLLVQCLHWFNPAVWYMAHLIDRDTELACDEAALRLLPQQEHRVYGETVFHAAERLKSAS